MRRSSWLLAVLLLSSPAVLAKDPPQPECDDVCRFVKQVAAEKPDFAGLRGAEIPRDADADESVRNWEGKISPPRWDCTLTEDNSPLKMDESPASYNCTVTGEVFAPGKDLSKAAQVYEATAKSVARALSSDWKITNEPADDQCLAQLQKDPTKVPGPFGLPGECPMGRLIATRSVTEKDYEIMEITLSLAADGNGEYMRFSAFYLKYAD